MSQSKSPRPIWVSVYVAPRLRMNAQPDPGFPRARHAPWAENAAALTEIKADLRGFGVSHASTNTVERF